MNAHSWSKCVWAIVLVALVGSPALAEGGRPSRDTLAAMGLSGLTVVSDADALTIRGQGYKGGSSVSVFGNSFATINTKYGGAHSENGYVADGKHYASGGNGSVAGTAIISSGGKGGYGKPGGHVNIKVIKVFAGGYSSAKAF